MEQGVGQSAERKILLILKVLSESSEPLGSIIIARELNKRGVFLSERAVRQYLRIADERGYTEPMGRDGRMITSQGLEELQVALAPDQISFIQEKLELLAFRTTFDPKKRKGLLPINTSLFNRHDFSRAMDIMNFAFKSEICVSHLIAVTEEGKKLGDVVVPKGKVGLATVCGAAVNGVLLKRGIPMESKFGAVLEIENSQPKRFVAIINYGGTSIDPAEQYIRAGMTSVTAATKTGTGKILANFREIPALSRSMVEEAISDLKVAGINGVYALGGVSKPVCQIPVSLNRVGMVLLGGLNPVAAAAEAGIAVENVAESGMIDFEQLVSYSTFKS